MRSPAAHCLAALAWAGVSALPANASVSGASAEHASQLPRSPAGMSLNPDAVIARIAFGSCLHQDGPHAILQTIIAQRPHLFVLLGDNVYGDHGWAGDAELRSLADSYRRLSVRPEFTELRRAVPMLTTWDDHDFGLNDAGRSFAFKRQSETFYENFWNATPEVRSRSGVYDSRIVGQPGRRIQTILLDTRFFRSDLKRAPYSFRPAPLGNYLPADASDQAVLGEEQWRWLEQELAKPAELRLVVSSIQVLTDAHRFESWSRFPRERERLYATLARRGGGKLLIVSGDRHASAIYSSHPPQLDEPLIEMTSSSLNLPAAQADLSAREPDPLRLTALHGQAGFGLLDVDWEGQRLILSLRDAAGDLIAQHVANFRRNAGR